jgi:hypothetical protein
MGRARLMRGSAALGLVALMLAGCASAQEPEVTRVATAFENPSGNPEARCDLLAPATLKAFEKDQTSSCSDAVAQLSLDGGTVTKVEVWGGDAQVRMTGDTVFLTETDAGWRVTAASCTSQGEAPYDCEVEGP